MHIHTGPLARLHEPCRRCRPLLCQVAEEVDARSRLGIKPHGIAHLLTLPIRSFRPNDTHRRLAPRVALQLRGSAQAALKTALLVESLALESSTDHAGVPFEDALLIVHEPLALPDGEPQACALLKDEDRPLSIELPHEIRRLLGKCTHADDRADGLRRPAHDTPARRCRRSPPPSPLFHLPERLQLQRLGHHPLHCRLHQHPTCRLRRGGKIPHKAHTHHGLRSPLQRCPASFRGEALAHGRCCYKCPTLADGIPHASARLDQSRRRLGRRCRRHLQSKLKRPVHRLLRQRLTLRLLPRLPRLPRPRLPRPRLRCKAAHRPRHLNGSHPSLHCRPAHCGRPREARALRFHLKRRRKGVPYARGCKRLARHLSRRA